MIREYLQGVQEALAAYMWVQSVQVLRCEFEETDLEDILVYRFRVTLQDGGVLEFSGAGRLCETRVTPSRDDLQISLAVSRPAIDQRWDNAPAFSKTVGLSTPYPCWAGGQCVSQ